MESTLIILLLLVAVVASSMIQRSSPVAIPLPFVQVALGALIAATSDFSIALDPEFFLLLFIAPLLFLDGWRIPKAGLFHDKWTICALALGLVIFTVVGAGFFIHWLIPAMPLAIAFALAAILSPTDAVAVSAITAKSPIPKRLSHILEGESLLNDASGLVCLRFAVACAVTGSFSIVDASLSFLWLAAGGITAGVGVTLLANAAKDWIARQFGEETGAQILVSLLIPFGAYLTAEHLHASGILAAVAAGLTMSYEEQTGRALPVTRIRRTAVWDAVQFAGNGVIFVLLGQQLPAIIAGAERAVGSTGHQNVLWLILYIVAVGCVLALLRALWAWATLRLILFSSTGSGSEMETPGWRVIGVTTLSGVRGALTLSGVMTLPLTLQDGAAFPTRDLAILLAAGVILVSLIAANVGLAYVLKGAKMPCEASDRQNETEARLAAAQAAIEAIECNLRTLSPEEKNADLRMLVGARLLAQYRQRVEDHARSGAQAEWTWQASKVEHGLHHLALRAERDTLYRLVRSGKLTDEAARMLVREVDLQESRFGDT